MLKRRPLAAALGALLALAGGAFAQDDEVDDGLRRPQRLTVGSADQLLGQLAPDGRRLYYVSNRNTTTEIDVQDLTDGRSHLLFDEGTDVSWPRVSPDGRALLYVSFRERATGQLCVRDLPGAGSRRCLDDQGSALQAEWIDARRIALVSRPAVQGDLALLEVTVGHGLSARPLLQRNLTSPAISPDGRWVVYVPVERQAPRVGAAFASRASGRLEAARLDRPGTPPIQLALHLPGESSQPAFARDGQHLYVAQFFSDSNHDETIDNDDHGVLFRVPFPSRRDDAPAVAAAAFAEQLTDESWNCQYPAPAADQLIATCSRGHGLDLYELPLDGEVPSAWTAERVGEEIDLGGSGADRLLLYRHRLARATSRVGRRLNMVRLVRLHLDADEFAPAEFYARHVAALEDAEAAGLSSPLLALIEQRRARRDRERGRMGADFAEEARRRLAALSQQKPVSPAAGILTAVVKSEIQDDLGDKGAARRELETVTIPDHTPRSILELYHGRADALYRELDDQAALAQTCRRLATLPSLAAPDQLVYARAAVRAWSRGLSFDEASARLARERAQAPDDSELAFALDLGRVVLAVRGPTPPPEVEARLLDLYARQARPDRRRAVIDEAVKRAGDQGAGRLIEGLAERYLADVKPGTGERRQAQRLYRRVLTARAYQRIADGNRAEARADFEAVAERTDSLESLIGALDLRIRAGEKPEALIGQFRGVAGAKATQAALARAYLSARAIPHLPEAEQAGAAAAAMADLRANWGALRNNRAAQDIYGALLHQEYLRTGNPALAERADAHYLVALEMVQGNVRYRATVLGQLALLQMAVANHRIALTYLEQRQRLPFPDNTAALAMRLATARVLLHVGRDKDAVQAAEAALAMIPHAPRLQKFRALALDRAALCNLAAGRFGRALELYDLAVPVADADSGPGGVRNRLVSRLARAAAALGANQPRRAIDDLDIVDRQLAEPRVTARLRWPHAAPADVLDTYRLIAGGLRANANRSLGDLAGVTRALEERRATFADRLKRSDRDEDLRALVLAELRLAHTAADRRAPSDAARWVGQAADHAGELAKRTHAPVDAAELDALWMAAELGAAGGAPLPFDLAKRLQDAYGRLVQQHDPAWRTYQAWFEAYLALALTAPPAR